MFIFVANKEIAFDNFKVLLFKVHGQLYATSHKCTHYGAPLMTGVFSSDGQSPPSDTNNVVLIIGGGAAGNAAAEKLREIIVVSREPHLPIDRPKLSKSLGMRLERIEIRNKEFYDGLFITFKLGTTVTAVDTVNKIVILNNNEKLKYNKLIIATGADPRSIPVPGIEFSNVFFLRTYSDYEKIENAVGKKERKDLVIIGSSFIGMEVAAMCTKKANVSVIGMEKVPFERILGHEIGAALKKLYESNGVKFYLQADVKEIQPSETDPTRAGSVLLDGGKKIYADFIVMGTGVKPATEFLKDSPGFNLQRDGSLNVDEQFKVEGLEDVFAIGDIARFPYHITGETLRIEHWSFAENTGRGVAAVITNTNIKPFKKTPYFWSNQLGKGIRFAGYASSYDDIIIQGSLEELKFAAYYARGDKILAVCTISKDPWASHCSELDPIEVPLTE
ncbi:368_t:CDS:10 [Diversispora eburnea]|uniref:368_t:CDS:1 n=1 Tax=Diversispora eburnea TaxID=1213867 RepID=A0A9N8VZX5_9GLOM|nr:368_t:CDS:10 [Diversispora eburnea]